MPAIPAIAVFAANGALAGGVASIGTALGLGSGMLAAVAGGAIVGAVAGGVVAAVTGQDVLKGALMGGVTGGLMGAVVGAPEVATTGGDVASLASAEANAGIAQAADVAATGTTGAMEQSGSALAKGADYGQGIMQSAGQATANANVVNASAGEQAIAASEGSKTALANATTKEAVDKGAMQAVKDFWGGLDSGEKMIAMTGLGGVVDSGMSYMAAKDAEKASEEQYQRQQLTASNAPTNTMTMVKAPSFSAPTGNSIAASQGLLLQKPKIQTA